MEEEEPVYKLIHAFDPTKVNVPFRERFAKLTLSSNKKKKDHAEDGIEGEKPPNNPTQIEKRQSASRNLLDLLTASQEHATESGRPKCVNPLLQSDSSSSAVQLEDETQLDILEEQLDVHIATAEQLVTHIAAAEQSEVMECLLMSEDDSSLLTEDGEENVEDDMARQIVALSQQVSAITLSSTPTMVSATPSSHELTQLISTESQRMSSSGEPLRPTQMPPRLKLQKCIAPTAELDSEISIVVPSSNEDEEEEETESAITISDSTESNITALDEVAVSAIDYDGITSVIPQSGETGEALLPSTFSNDKADRMEAFLRDVSQEFREMAERPTEAQEDTIGETTLDTTEKTPTQESSADIAAASLQLNVTPHASMTKSQRLRNADTESMSSNGGEALEIPVQTKPTEREQRLLALNDTVSMSQSHSSIFNQMSAVWKTPRSSEASSYQNTNNKSEDAKAKRLASDDTVVNTLVSGNYSNASFTSQNSEINESHNSTPNNSMQRSAAAAAEDSIVISETSSEGEPSSTTRTPKLKTPTPRTPTFKTPTARTPIYKTPTTTSAPSNEIVESADQIASEDPNSPFQSQLSQVQMSMGSINISAKINIKIHISQQFSSDEEEAQLSSEEDNNNDDNNRKKPLSLPSTEENSNSSEKIDKQIVRKKATPLKATDPVVEVANHDTPQSEIEDGVLLTDAQEKMLTELYGKSWQTPDVMRTLRRTSATNERTSSMLKKTTAAASKAQKLTPSSMKNNKKQTAAPDSAAAVEESILLDDFSIFRRNIVKTNLDSTRLLTPKPQTGSRAGTKSAITSSTEPRRRVAAAVKTRKESDSVFKEPQTEVKCPQKPVITTRNGRVVNARWQKLIDSDSEDSTGANASDDSDADLTGTSRRSGKSDDSWKEKDDSENNSSDNEIEAPTRRTKRQTRTRGGADNKKSVCGSKEKLVYLDLSHNEVSVMEGTPGSPPANHDATFAKRLQDILRTCAPAEKPKLDATPKTTIKPKRKLFTVQRSYDDDAENVEPPETPKQKTAIRQVEEIVDLTTPIRNAMPIINKQLEAIKGGTPIFKITPPRSKTKSKLAAQETPKSAIITGHANIIKDLLTSEYSFLKSLDPHLCKSRCDREALVYRENYRLKKEELSGKLYKLFNEKIFDNRLSVQLIWNKKLINTAGRCLNRKKLSVRSSTVELSEKVLSSADRLRCTLVHELCHAATWVFSGEGGHGATWKEWARKSNSVFPELPKISRCHNYEIEYKYTYKCTMCAAKSHAHSKSKKVENIRCSYCHGAIEIFLNKKDKDGNVIPTPVREPTGFAKFVKDNYKQYKRDDRKHADVMKCLSNEFAALKVAGNAN